MHDVFSFSEATHWVQEGQQDIAVLLDIEKAYNRVDSSFLEGTARRLGFCDHWILWASSLYCHSTSRMVPYGGRGPAFQLSRSV